MALAEGKTLRAADLSDGQAFGRSSGVLAAVTVGAYAALTGPAATYLKDANGHYWRLSVSILGVLTTTDVGTSVPAIVEESA